MIRGLKFQIKEVEGLYYIHLCCDNKGADQLRNYRAADLLRNYRAADLGPCFPICKKLVYSVKAALLNDIGILCIVVRMFLKCERTTKMLIRLHIPTVRSMPLFFH